MNTATIFSSEVEVFELPDGDTTTWLKDTPWARLYKEAFRKVFWKEVDSCPLWWLKAPGKWSFFCYVLHNQKTILVPPWALSISSKVQWTGVGTQIQHIFERAAEDTGYNLICAITKKDEKLWTLLRQNGYFECKGEHNGLTYFIHKVSPRIIEWDRYSPEVRQAIGIFRCHHEQLDAPLEGVRKGFWVKIKNVLK